MPKRKVPTASSSTTTTNESRKRGRPANPVAPYNGQTFGLTEGTVREVSLDELDLNDKAFQFRFALRANTLVDSIKTQGVQIPLMARPHPDGSGKLQLICGFRRATASKLAGLAKVPVIVRELGDDEAHMLSYTENEYRKTLRDLDRAHAIAKLRSSGKKTLDIAHLYRMSDRQIQRLEGLLNYPEELQAAMDDDTVLTTHALVLMQASEKYGKKLKLADWIEHIRTEQPSVETLKANIKEKLEGKQGKQRFAVRQGEKVTVNLGLLKKGYEKEKALEELRKLVAEVEAHEPKDE